MAWTREQENRVRQLWAEGDSASSVASKLAAEFTDATFTRDMIIGKARRLGLESRPSPIIRKEAA